MRLVEHVVLVEENCTHGSDGKHFKKKPEMGRHGLDSSGSV